MSNTIKVQFEATPNPATMKFLFPQTYLDFSIEFKDVDQASKSPLASKIFGFPWTSSVFLGPNFISVTKQDWVEWEVLADPLAGLIAEHLDSGLALYVDVPDSNQNDEDENDPAIVKQIKQILNRDIRPVVAMDGGDVAFAKYENQILYLQMKGSCHGCPSSQATLKDGIEVRIRELLPEVKEVVSI